MNLRQEAKGRPCTCQIPGVCNGNLETTVLAHLNERSLFGVGIGQKVPDLFGAWSCSACHDVLDGRTKTDFKYWELRVLHYQGIMRTQNILLKEKKIKV